MDPLTAFVTIVQLLAIFMQGRGEAKKTDHQEFLAWLAYHKHEQLKELILNSQHLTNEVQQLLQRDHATILAGIESINKITVEILARIDSFAGMARTLVPERIVSQDALELLQAFYSSNESDLIWLPGSDTLRLGTSEQCIKVSSGRFLQDDLTALVDLGFLSGDWLDKWRCYKPTRRGAAFVSQSQPKQPRAEPGV